MPPLTPQDWEMTPRYRLLDSAPCALSCGGANRWQLHLVKLPSWDYSFLWMRPLDVESDAGFVAFDKALNREWIFGRETLHGLAPQIAAVADKHLLARRFVLNTRGELRAGNQRAHEILIVTRDGIARWSNHDNSENTPFRWRPPSESLSGARFVALSAARVWSELQGLLADPDGEAAFARGFARLNSQQRDARIQRPRHGTLDELNRVLHQLLLATAPWESVGDDELFVSFTRRDDARLWKIGRNNPDEMDVPAAMREGVQRLWDRFEPFALIDANYLCAQSTDTPSIFARAHRPSAHERLEAQLQLRDW